MGERQQALDPSMVTASLSVLGGPRDFYRHKLAPCVGLKLMWCIVIPVTFECWAQEGGSALL